MEGIHVTLILYYSQTLGTCHIYKTWFAKDNALLAEMSKYKTTFVVSDLSYYHLGFIHVIKNIVCVLIFRNVFLAAKCYLSFILTDIYLIALFFFLILCKYKF